MSAMLLLTLIFTGWMSKLLVNFDLGDFDF